MDFNKLRAKLNDDGVADVIRGFLMAGVFMLISVYVLYAIVSGTPAIGGGVVRNNATDTYGLPLNATAVAYNNTLVGVNALVNSGIGLMAVSLIVIAAVGILYYLGFLGGGKQ